MEESCGISSKEKMAIVSQSISCLEQREVHLVLNGPAEQMIYNILIRAAIYNKGLNQQLMKRKATHPPNEE